MYLLCFYDLEFTFRLWFATACCMGCLNDPKNIWILYALWIFCCAFHNIKVCTRCDFMTLNSLLDCDLPLYALWNASILLCFPLRKLWCVLKKMKHTLFAPLIFKTQYKIFVVSHSTVTFLPLSCFFRF